MSSAALLLGVSSIMTFVRRLPTEFLYGRNDSLTDQKMLFAVLVLYASVALAVETVKVQGSDFVNTVTGARLQIVGVA